MIFVSTFCCLFLLYSPYSNNTNAQLYLLHCPLMYHFFRSSSLLRFQFCFKLLMGMNKVTNCPDKGIVVTVHGVNCYNICSNNTQPQVLFTFILLLIISVFSVITS